MDDSQLTGLTVDEREAIEALAKAYVLIGGEDWPGDTTDRDDLLRCVRCVQDRIMAQPTRRRFRGVEAPAGPS